MHKRGQGEQFNWIFILVAGTIVLTFFILFTFKYVALQDQKHNVDVARTFTQNIQLLQSSGVDDYVLDTDSFDFGIMRTFAYECLDATSFLTINNDYTQKITNALLFMPEQTTTSSFRAWIRSWNAPYYIENLLFFEPPNTHHLFIIDPTTATYLTDINIPQTFSTTTIQRGSALPKLSGTIRVAYITSTKPTASELSTLSATYTIVHAIHIHPITNDVTFYTNTKATGTIHTSPVLVIGALFTDTATHYSCLINTSRQHAETITKMYIEKTKILSRMQQNVACDYQPLQRALQNTLQTTQSQQHLIDTNNALSGNGCQSVF